MFAGIDTHKDTLAVAVVDGTGRAITQEEVPNTEAGFLTLVQLFDQLQVERVGIEGSGAFGRAVAVHLSLVCPDRLVVEISTLMSSRERGARPGKGKTDPVDAVAIARITARETNLPTVRLTVGPAADLRALLDYREQLVHERGGAANRVHAEMTGLRPGYQLKIAALTMKWQLNAVLQLLEGDPSVRAELCRRRLLRVLEIDQETTALTKQITALVKASRSTLTEHYGVGPLVAARFIAEVVDVRRYPTRDTFASANGTAPLPASSGRTVRHRLNRGGNRQLNRALYTMAITQIRTDTVGRAYYDRKRAQGKTSREALRCLERRLSDQIYRTMRNDQRADELRHIEPQHVPPLGHQSRREITPTERATA